MASPPLKNQVNKPPEKSQYTSEKQAYLPQRRHHGSWPCRGPSRLGYCSIQTCQSNRLARLWATSQHCRLPWWNSELGSEANLRNQEGPTRWTSQGDGRLRRLPRSSCEPWALPQRKRDSIKRLEQTKHFFGAQNELFVYYIRKLSLVCKQRLFWLTFPIPSWETFCVHTWSSERLAAIIILMRTWDR